MFTVIHRSFHTSGYISVRLRREPQLLDFLEQLESRQLLHGYNWAYGPHNLKELWNMEAADASSI